MSTIMNNNGITPYNSTIKEQSLSHIEKVKSFSESYIVSCAVKTFIASTALSFVGFSFSTTIPICFTVIVCTSLIGFAIQNVKASISTLAKKCMSLLIETAKIVNDVFKKIFSIISSFLEKSSYIDFHRIPDKKIQINYATITQTPHSTEEKLCVVDDFFPQIAQALMIEESEEDTLVIEENIALIPQTVIEEAPETKEEEIEKDAPVIEENVALIHQTVIEEAPEIKKDSLLATPFVSKEKFLTKPSISCTNFKIAESLQAAFLFEPKQQLTNVQSLSLFKPTTINCSNGSQRLASIKQQKPSFFNVVKPNFPKPVGPNPYLVKGVKLLRFLKK